MNQWNWWFSIGEHWNMMYVEIIYFILFYPRAVCTGSTPSNWKSTEKKLSKRYFLFWKKKIFFFFHKIKKKSFIIRHESHKSLCIKIWTENPIENQMKRKNQFLECSLNSRIMEPFKLKIKMANRTTIHNRFFFLLFYLHFVDFCSFCFVHFYCLLNISPRTLQTLFKSRDQENNRKKVVN